MPRFVPPSTLPSCSGVRKRSDAKWASSVRSRDVIAMGEGASDRTPHFARILTLAAVSMMLFYQTIRRPIAFKHRVLRGLFPIKGRARYRDDLRSPLTGAEPRCVRVGVDDGDLCRSTIGD